MDTVLDAHARGVGAQVDPSETRTLKGMYVQLVDNQVLSTPEGQPDVSLHRLTGIDATRRRTTASTRALVLGSTGYFHFLIRHVL